MFSIKSERRHDQPTTGMPRLHGLMRVSTTLVSIAIVVAMTEVLARWARSDETFSAPQLLVATVANVTLLATMAFVATIATCWLKLLFLRQRRLGTRPTKSPLLSVTTRVSAVAVWLLCVGTSVSLIEKTRGHVESWLRESTPDAVSLDTATPNIMLIVLDTLRADRVGVYGTSELTPHLDHLAESSLVYTSAISTAPWTLPTHASLFTGTYPDVHGVSWGHHKLGDDLPVIGELLKERGYESFAISNNWILNQRNGFARGFDSFIETSRDSYLSKWRLALQCGAVRRAATWFGLSIDTGFDAGSCWTNWLLRQRFENKAYSQPFFAFVNFFEPHDPYRPLPRLLNVHLEPQERDEYHRLPQQEILLGAHACGHRNIFTDEQITLMSRLYDAEVAYQDEVIGELLEILQDNAPFENTWIIVTADHGELFGEQDMVYHGAGSHNKLLHVPLIVRPPGGTSRQIRISAPVQPVDIAATILAVAGVEPPPTMVRAHRLPMDEEHTGGRSICVAQSFGAAPGFLSATQRLDPQVDVSQWLTWITSVYADGYLLELDPRAKSRLYRVGEDPTMEHDLAAESPELVRTMTAAFQEWCSGDTLRNAQRIQYQGTTSNAALVLTDDMGGQK